MSDQVTLALGLEFVQHLSGASDIPNAKSLLRSQKTAFFIMLSSRVGSICAVKICLPSLHASNAPKVLNVAHVKVGLPTQDKMQYIVLQ